MSTSGQRKIFLRLDDGSLIGRASDLGTEPASQKVVRLSVDQAAQIGRATDKEVERLQSILIRIKAQYHVQPAALEPARSLPPIKKARVDPLPQPVPAATPGPWQSKCKEMLKAVIKNLGPNSGVFYNPVDAKLLPDYYKIVTQPLFLRDIDARLNGGQYQMPDEFHRDMKHHFDNVRLYNPKGDPFRNMGEKAEDLFETLWNTAGFNVERSRRLTAGQAAPKFEPEQFDAPAKPKPSRSQQGGAGKRPRDGAQRTASHEVTSGKNGLDDTGRLLPSRIQEMGQYLSREDLPEEQSTHLLNLLPPAMLEGIQSGELELDLDAMDNETLIRIDQWLRSLPEAQAMLSPVQPQPSVRVDSYDDDEDYEEDSDESD